MYFIKLGNRLDNLETVKDLLVKHQDKFSQLQPEIVFISNELVPLLKCFHIPSEKRCKLYFIDSKNDYDVAKANIVTKLKSSHFVVGSDATDNSNSEVIDKVIKRKPENRIELSPTKLFDDDEEIQFPPPPPTKRVNVSLPRFQNAIVRRNIDYTNTDSNTRIFTITQAQTRSILGYQLIPSSQEIITGSSKFSGGQRK